MNRAYLKKAITFSAVICLMLSVGGCGSRDSSSAQSDSTQAQATESTEALSAKEILTQIKEAYSEHLDTEYYYGDEVFIDNFKKLYGIEYEEISDGGIIYAGSGGLADEVSVLKPADGDTDHAVSALEARRDMRIEDFTGYKPDEVTKVENCEIFSQDGYAVIVISDDAAEIAEKIKAMI